MYDLTQQNAGQCDEMCIPHHLSSAVLSTIKMTIGLFKIYF